MKTNRNFLLVVVFLFTVVSVMLINQGTVLATESLLVKIEPVKDINGKLIGFFVNPKNIEIKENTIVIWLSGIYGQEIQVIFEDGKTCKDVTADPHFFEFNPQTSCYVTNYIPYGATSSLRFPQAGVFNYVVSSQDGKMKFPATLIVR